MAIEVLDVGGVNASISKDGSNPASIAFQQHIPGGLKIGDLAIFWVASFGPTYTGTWSGTGISSIVDRGTTGICRLNIVRQRVVTNDGQTDAVFTRTVSVSNSTTFSGGFFLRGADTNSNPIGSLAQNDISNSAAPDPGGITSVTIGSLAITILASNQETTVPSANFEALTPPSGWTLGAAASDTTGNDASTAIAYKIAASSTEDPGVWGTHWASTIDHAYATFEVHAWPYLVSVDTTDLVEGPAVIPPRRNL